MDADGKPLITLPGPPPHLRLAHALRRQTPAQLDAVIGQETEGRLPLIAGGVAVALAETFRIVDPKVRNPSSAQWERAQRIFDLRI